VEHLNKLLGLKRLNPFGAGRGLSTTTNNLDRYVVKVSIPLEQGGVFRQLTQAERKTFTGFNPFGTGRGLSTARVVWSLGG
jgi:hypothetical protein